MLADYRYMVEMICDYFLLVEGISGFRKRLYSGNVVSLSAFSHPL